MHLLIFVEMYNNNCELTTFWFKTQNVIEPFTEKLGCTVYKLLWKRCNICFH